MPEKLEKSLMAQARKKGLKGKARDKYVYGTMTRVAGPAGQESGGYSTPHAKPAGGGGDVTDMVIGQVEDKGKYCRVSVASNGERSQWVSAWDKAADAVRGLPPNSKIKGVLQTSKDGRFVNLKDVQVVTEPLDIPF